MKLIYVCSPYRGNPPHLSQNVEYNLDKAEDYCNHVIKMGHLPIAPHLYFLRILDDTDPADRTMGIEMGLELLKICQEIWVFGNELSEGMKNELNFAKRYSIPIIFKGRH